MNARDILRCIDEGAEHFLRTLADAPHMTCTDAGGLTVIRPKRGQEGISFVCGLQMEGCEPAHWRDLIARAKAMHLPVWFPLCASDEQYACFFGRERLRGLPPAAEDEVYMALFPRMFVAKRHSYPVVKVTDAATFADCAAVVNAVLSDGRPDLHPVYHLPLMERGRMHAYVLYCKGQPVSAAVTMAKEDVASLEFVATLPDFRGQGYAEAVCRQAVQDSLNRSVQIITVRAVNAAAARLYQRLGFSSFNHAL